MFVFYTLACSFLCCCESICIAAHAVHTSDRLVSRNPCTRQPCGRTTHANVGNEIGSNVLCKDFVNPALGLGLLESWGLSACRYAAVAPNGGGRGYVAAARCCCTSGLARRLSRVRCRCARGLAVAFALRVKCRPFRFVVLGGVRKRARSDGLVN
jgi:hypothetical protein